MNIKGKANKPKNDIISNSTSAAEHNTAAPGNTERALMYVTTKGQGQVMRSNICNNCSGNPPTIASRAYNLNAILSTCKCNSKD